jgi:hypothetical protein
MKKVKLISPIKSKRLLSFFSFIFLIFIGMWSVMVTLTQPLLHLGSSTITVDTNTFATVIYKTDFASPVVKISPLTDYYYKKDYRNHVMTKVNPENQQISWQKFVVFLESMVMGRNKFIWTPSGSNEKEAIGTEYTVNLKNGVVSVGRRFLDSDITAIGQALTFCDGCYLGDTQKRLYTSSRSELGIVEVANKAQYSVVVVEHKLPVNITALTIVDRNGRVQATIPVAPADEIYYEEQWHLVEIKTPIVSKEQIFVQQEVKL